MSRLRHSCTKTWSLFGAVLFTLLTSGTVLCAQPQISVEVVDGRRVRVSWPDSALGFALEASTTLGPGASWLPVGGPPVKQNNTFSITIDATLRQQFLRLRALEYGTITETSPLDGETGVAVTRETIVRFSAPLAATAKLNVTNFFAGFGGRKLLSRVELSTDRKKASLFYLEPIPGNTRVTVVFNSDGLADAAGNFFDADGDGVPGGTRLIQFDTVNLVPLAGTAVVGQVFAAEPDASGGTNTVNRPLEGVIVTVDGREQEMRATTDAQGRFTLSPAPPGRFFVKIDGRRAKGSQWPNGSYYPYVGKAWDALAGVTNNPAGGTGQIFLPLVKAGTLQPVSATTPTTITMPADVVASNPALDGVSITVPANSLFSDDGQRGGRVGLAPVPSDRLPGPLPPGLNPPLVITVQTDGPLNFDVPAPVCFPNLPDPNTGKPWPAGTKGSLISFNHKKGVWEPAAGMTVSPDGRFFCTDPGEGVVQPGWHGVACPKPTAPPPPPNPPPPPPPPCKPDAKALAACFDKCADEAKECRLIAGLIHSKQVKTCNEFAATRGKEYAANCLKAAAKVYNDRLDACINQENQCDKSCAQCNGTPRPQRPLQLSAFSAGTGDAAVDLILADIARENELLQPYLSSDADIPADVLAQIQGLLTHSDSVAGGDTVSFLEGALAKLQREHEAAALARQLPDRGLPPPYPVLFAADIQRADQTITLRGQTEPFGQYWLYLAPDATLNSVSFYDPKTKSFGSITPDLRPEAKYLLPTFELHPLDASALDSDHDGLPDTVEIVYGTDAKVADTDGDGILDGAEVEQGTDPLGGLIVQTGIIATVKTTGLVEDVAAANDLIVTAEGAAGLSIFSKYNGNNPVLLSHLPLPGASHRVATDGQTVTVVNDTGLQIVSIADPSAARLLQNIPLTNATSATPYGDWVFTGTAEGYLLTVDPVIGRIVNAAKLSGPIRDLTILGDYLYALTDTQVVTLLPGDGSAAQVSSVASPGPNAPTLRLFAGGDLLYVVHRNGYNTFDLLDPAHPKLIKQGASQQFGWRQIAPTGSGSAVAAVGPNSGVDRSSDISLYDVRDPAGPISVVTTFPTPGAALAVTLWNGLAYVADTDGGLQVINYLPYDNKKLPPQIKLVPGFDTNNAASGSTVWIEARATDDQQVRNVELYFNDALVQNDASFPFEFRFPMPALSGNSNPLRIRTKAYDTGGNFAWSDEIAVNVLPDTTAPVVRHTTPIGGGARTLTTLSAFFSERLAASTVTPASFQLFDAANSPVSAAVQLDADERTVRLTFASLPVGHYRALLTTAITDVSGNHLTEPYTSEFEVADAAFWANYNSGQWDDPANWADHALPAQTDKVIVGVPVTIYAHSSTFGNAISAVTNALLVLDGTPTFNHARFDIDILFSGTTKARVINGLTLNRKLTMFGSLNLTQLNFDGSQVFDGIGEVYMTDPNYNTIQVQQTSGTLTLGTNLTIHGSGRVGKSGFPLVNHGRIVAEFGGFARIIVAGSNVENQGSLIATNSLLVPENLQNLGTIELWNSSLNLSGTYTPAQIGTVTGTNGIINSLGTLDNRNGTLTVKKGITWQLSTGTLLGGTIETPDGGEFVVTSPGGIFDGVTVNGALRAISAAHLMVTNGLTLNGTATLDGNLNITRLIFLGDQTLSGTGRLILNDLNVLTVVVESDTGTLTIANGITIRGGAGTIGKPTLPLLNHGKIIADGPSSRIRVYGKPFTNDGTIEQLNGGTVAINPP